MPLLNLIAALILSLNTCQHRPIRLNLPPEQDYFGIAPFKIGSESCNHARPPDNVRVEGRKSIRNTA